MIRIKYEEDMSKIRLYNILLWSDWLHVTSTFYSSIVSSLTFHTLKSPLFKNVSSVYIDSLQKVTKIGNSYFPYKNINVIYIAIKLSVRLIFIHLVI